MIPPSPCPPDPAAEFFFAYGTLWLGPLPEAVGRTMESQCQAWALGRIQARLHDLGDYPGAVPSEDPGDEVAGVVYRVREPASLWPILDAYEDLPRPDAPFGEFRREGRKVRLDQGGDCLAQVYFYHRPVSGFPRIPSGDYRDHLRARNRLA